jgi:hypothetical protein
MEDTELMRHITETIRLGERVTAVEYRIENIELMCAERYRQITEALTKMELSIEKSSSAVEKLALAMATNSGKGMAVSHVLAYCIGVAGIFASLYSGVFSKLGH